MKAHKTEKTNVMRLLDAAGIPYRTQEYEVDEKDLSEMQSLYALFRRMQLFLKRYDRMK